MDAFEALTGQRRSGIIAIKGRRFRITEPAPRLASVILTHLGQMIRPWVIKILSGHVIRTEPGVCPSCGNRAPEKINGERWLCQAVVQDSEASRPCATIWPRKVLLGEDGQPARLTFASAMADPGWRAVFAVSVGETLDDLDPDRAHALAMRMILAGTEWESVKGSGLWTAIADEKTVDMALAQAGIGGMGIVRLAKAHLEIWALPSLVDDWTDTSPASPTTATAGGSETREPVPQASAPGGRVPPRTQRRKG